MVQTDVELAKEFLQKYNYSLVVVKEDVLFVSRKPGILPIVNLCNEQLHKYYGASLADKVIGKAAALLLAETGVKEVYAQTISIAALPVLKQYGITYSYGELVPAIQNRLGDDLCPMEKLCADIESPTEAMEAIQAFITANKK